MMKFLIELATAHGSMLHIYYQFGIDESRWRRFENSSSPFTMFDGKISRWDHFDLEPG